MDHSTFEYLPAYAIIPTDIKSSKYKWELNLHQHPFIILIAHTFLIEKVADDRLICLIIIHDIPTCNDFCHCIMAGISCGSQIEHNALMIN